MPSTDGLRTGSLVDRITIGAFLLAIAAPAADELVRSDDARGPAPELREAEPAPGWPTGLWSLTSFPEQYDDHFKDTFGLRDVLLRGHAIAKLFVYGVPPSTQVIVGEDGWLFYTGDASVEVFRGLMPFSESDLEAWRQKLEARRDFLRQQGIEYLYVIAPNKESIYPEYMPPSLNVLGPTRLDQLAEYLRAHSDVEFLDLRSTLLDKKLEDVADDWLYVRLGTHWNGRGAYESYRAIVERLARRFPALVPFDREYLDLKVLPGFGDTWGTRMYIEDLLPQRAVAYLAPFDPKVRASVQTVWGPTREVIKQKDDPELPRAVMFHDSFGPYIEDLLAHHFNSLVCSWRSDFDTVTIERAQPSVVFEVYVERILVNEAPVQPAPKAQHPDRDAYDRSTDVRWKLDTSAEAGGLELGGKTRVVRTPQDGELCFSIERESAADRLFLPEFDSRNARSLVLSADVIVPAATTLTVFFLPPGETEFKHRNQLRALLRAGHNRAYLRLDPSTFHGRLYLHTGSELTGVALCALEVRAVD